MASNRGGIKQKRPPGFIPKSGPNAKGKDKPKKKVDKGKVIDSK